jgi:hypothetical protein
MRIRQVRPETFTDPVTGHLPPAVLLTYIGLWCVADDAGWFAWDVDQLGALLYPYKSIRVRTRGIAVAGEALVRAGRITLHECGCAFIPTLADHQKIGGNKSFTARDNHRVHTRMDESARNVTVGNGRVGNGSALRSAALETGGFVATLVKGEA